MKKTQFKLSNNFGIKIELSIEPEGTIFELPNEKTVIVEMTGEDNPLIDLQINNDNGSLYISIWPEKGNFEIIPQ